MKEISEERQWLHGSENWHDGAVALINKASRSIKLFIHTLSPGIYDRSDLVSALSKLIKENRHAIIKILVIDPLPAIQNGHQLISLSRRLSSYIHIKRVAQDYAHHEEEFILVDDINLMFKIRYSDHKFWLQAKAIPDAQRYANWFTEVWERSEVDPEFRELKL